MRTQVARSGQVLTFTVIDETQTVTYTVTASSTARGPWYFGGHAIGIWT